MPFSEHAGMMAAYSADIGEGSWLAVLQDGSRPSDSINR
jgi:hypothetical protein